MLLSRKRGRDMGDLSKLPVLRRPDRHIDGTWFLRDLDTASPARAQVLDFLRRDGRAEEPAGARTSSQELFLSVVLEWQRASVDERPADAWRLRGAVSALAPASSSGSDYSESEDERARGASCTYTEDESPTSVHAVPPTPTPLQLDAGDDTGKRIGAYSPRARRELLRRYMAKRAKRLSQHTVRYRVRKTLANARPRVKGRFVKTQAPLTAAAVEAMQPPPSATSSGDDE